MVTSAIRIWRTALAAESHSSCLVDPEEVDVPVEVAGYRDEHTVPPIEGGLVGDAAQLGRTLDGNVAAHEPDCVSSRGLEQKEHRKLSSLSIGSAHAF